MPGALTHSMKLGTTTSGIGKTGLNRHESPTTEAVLALTEAWSWLLNRGLVVWNVRQDTSSSFLVTRQGHAALDQGPPRIRAIQRLDIELVPALEAKARPQFRRGDFEATALLAMREVELHVRTMAGLPNSPTGTARAASFRRSVRVDAGSGLDGGRELLLVYGQGSPAHGPLWRPVALPSSERRTRAMTLVPVRPGARRHFLRRLLFFATAR